MKGKLLITALIFALGLGVVSCSGNKKAVDMGEESWKHLDEKGIIHVRNPYYRDKDLDLPAFSAIDVQRGIKAVVKFADGKQKVRAHIPTELMPYLQASVKGGTLRLTFEGINNVNINNGNQPMVYITVPSLHTINVSAGGGADCSGDLKINKDLKVESSSGGSVSLSSASCQNLRVSATSGSNLQIWKVKTDQVKLDANSGANVDIRGIKAQSLDCVASSAANVNLDGDAGKSVSYEASSAANVKASGLKARAVNANASSAASVACNASESIKGRGSSGGSVKYSGRPGDIDINRAVKSIY